MRAGKDSPNNRGGSGTYDRGQSASSYGNNFRATWAEDLTETSQAQP